MNKLLELPVFDSSYANCDSCELKSQLERQQFCCAYRPQNFNGVMIVGEGPGQQEVANGRPFVGNAGKLLRDLLTTVGIDLDECFVSNATLCKPPPKEDALHKAYPNAIPSCLGRLEKEIEAVQPRVIVALGSAAWIALSGYDIQKTRSVPFSCPDCDVNRKVGPVIQCAAALPNPADNGATAVPCGHLHFFDATCKENVDPEEVLKIRSAPCPKCGAKRKGLRPKMIKCPSCGGRKRRHEPYTVFHWDYTITKAAGAIFEPAQSPGARADHELDYWYRQQGVQFVLPTYHPAFLLRGQQFYAKTVQKHLQKVKRLLAGAKIQEVNYKVTSDPEVVRAFCFRDWSDKPAPVHTVDIETEAIVDGVALDARKIRNVTAIKCVGISRLDETLVVDTRFVDPSNPNDPLLGVLYDFLTSDIPKGYHHGAGYDIPVLDLLWGIPWEEQVRSAVDDSMFAHTNLYPDEPHDLAHVTFECADVHAWKPARKVNGAEVHENFEELALYNARDAWHTALNIDNFGVARGKAIPGGRMDRAGLSQIYAMDCKLRQIAVGMTMRGMPVNRKKFRAVGEKSRRLIADAERNIRQALHEAKHPSPDEVNLNSTPQLIELLYGTSSFFHLTAIDMASPGTPSTTKVAFQKLLSTTQDPQALAVLSGLIELRGQQYIARNFVFSPAMQPWGDGRIHSIWKPWGTKTGRWSSSPNLQNQPQWLRDVFEAPKGRVIVGADADQLELRMIGWLSGSKDLVRRTLNADEKRKLEPEYDPHSFGSSHAFPTFTSLSLNDPLHKKAAPGEVIRCTCQTCRRKLFRDIFKRVIYGMNYGAGDARVVEAIYDGGYEGPPITTTMVAHVRRTIYKLWPEIPEWRDGEVRKARLQGAIYSPIYHRRRIFPLADWRGVDVPVTEIYNYPIQSGGGDIINEGFLDFHARLPAVDPSAFIIAQYHDAIYAEADEDKGNPVLALLTSCMTCEKERDGVTMRFSASGKVGKTLHI